VRAGTRFEGGYLMGIRLGIYIAIELNFSKPRIDLAQPNQNHGYSPLPLFIIMTKRRRKNELII
jgi:hypothetical protein